MALPPPQEFTAKQQPIPPNELPLVQRESRPQHDQEEPKAERVEREALNPNERSWVPFHDGEIDRKPRLKSFGALKAGEMNDVKLVLRDLTATDGLACTILEAQYRQNQRIQELIQQQQHSTLALTLPESEVPTFSGNPIEYWSFGQAFENLIESRTTSNSARQYYLLQYTSGEVRELMRSCLAMKPEDGYQEARTLLKDRYGQSYRIATAYVERLTNGPPIKAEDSVALRRFSVLLTGWTNTVGDTGYLSKAENPETLRMIVKRLP